jgi:hypothetical protein
MVMIFLAGNSEDDYSTIDAIRAEWKFNCYITEIQTLKVLA